MKERKTLSRREFTVASALAALSGVAITVSGCGGSSSSPTTPSTPAPPPATGGTSDKVGSISSNHGHSAVITGAELTAGGALSLDITGTSDHPHSVELTEDEVGAIAANQRVSKESSVDASHSHTVTFN